MKKFETAKLEVVKLNMPSIIATSDLGICNTNYCDDNGAAKENIWGED